MSEGLWLGALLARLRSDVVKAANDLEMEVEDRRRAWAEGYLRGLQRAVEIIKDFLVR